MERISLELVAHADLNPFHYSRWFAGNEGPILATL